MYPVTPRVELEPDGTWFVFCKGLVVCGRLVPDLSVPK